MKPKIRKILIILFSTVCSCCMLFPIASYSSIRLSAHADYLNKTEENEIWERVRLVYDMLVYGSDPNYANASKGEKSLFTILDEMEEKLGTDSDIATVKSDIEIVKKQTDVDVSDKSTAEGIMKIPQFIASVTNGLWSAIITEIENQDPASATYTGSMDDTIVLTINPLDKKFKPITDIFKIAAYSLVLVFFSVNLIEQSVKYEVFTIKGSLRIFGRLIVSKVIIDLSTTICGKILGAVGYIIVKILNEEDLTSFDSFMPDVDLKASEIKLVGNVIDTLVAIVLASAILLIVGTVLIFTILVVIKLLLRAFELTMLVCTSPVFFACASSDVTKEYSKKFIITFLEVACQTLFMCVALKIGMGVLAGHVAGDPINGFGDLSKFFSTQIPYMIVLIAMCVMMIKPPKVLTNLLK